MRRSETDAFQSLNFMDSFEELDEGGFYWWGEATDEPARGDARPTG
jgi:hypothetical protein